MTVAGAAGVARTEFVSGVFDGALGGTDAADGHVVVAFRGVGGAVHQSTL